MEKIKLNFHKEDLPDKTEKHTQKRARKEGMHSVSTRWTFIKFHTIQVVSIKGTKNIKASFIRTIMCTELDVETKAFADKTTK